MACRLSQGERQSEGNKLRRQVEPHEEVQCLLDQHAGAQAGQEHGHADHRVEPPIGMMIGPLLLLSRQQIVQIGRVVAAEERPGTTLQDGSQAQQPVGGVPGVEHIGEGGQQRAKHDGALATTVVGKQAGRDFKQRLGDPDQRDDDGCRGVRPGDQVEVHHLDRHVEVKLAAEGEERKAPDRLRCPHRCPS